MESNNRYAALDPAALKALAKLRGVVTNDSEAVALKGLVAQDEQKGVEVNPTSNDEAGHTSYNADAVATRQGSNGEGDGHETSKKKRRRGKKGGVKSKKKENGTVADGDGATNATGHVKAADAPSMTEEAEATEQKLFEALQANMSPFAGIVKGFLGAAMLTVVVGLSGVITAGLIWTVS
jgi:hypothetical protein